MYEKQVIFTLGGQLYAVDSMKVRTVEAGGVVVPLAGAPVNVAGMYNLRGEWIPVYDLYRKFRMPATVSTQSIFINTAFGVLGFAVDKVNEIAVVDTEQEIVLPAIALSAETQYVRSIVKYKDELITILDTERLVTPDELKMLQTCLDEKREAENEVKRQHEEAERLRIEAEAVKDRAEADKKEREAGEEKIAELNAEKRRNVAEAERKTHEAERVKAEAKRVRAEAVRVKNEAVRVKAEAVKMRAEVEKAKEDSVIVKEGIRAPKHSSNMSE